MSLKKALIVVDYSYDFIASDGALTVGKPDQDIEDSINNKIVDFAERGDLVVFAMDYHESGDESHPETRLFPPHNIVGTPGRELYGKVRTTWEKYGKRPNVCWLDKVRYSAFYGTPLDAILRTHGVETVVISGVCTDICVPHTAMDSYNLSYRIEIPKSCVASFNLEGHNFALSHFRNTLGAEITE